MTQEIERSYDCAVARLPAAQRSKVSKLMSVCERGRWTLRSQSGQLLADGTDHSPSMIDPVEFGRSLAVIIKETTAPLIRRIDALEARVRELKDEVTRP